MLFFVDDLYLEELVVLPLCSVSERIFVNFSEGKKLHWQNKLQRKVSSYSCNKQQDYILHQHTSSENVVVFKRMLNRRMQGRKKKKRKKKGKTLHEDVLLAHT